jgi:hypothetical protein
MTALPPVVDRTPTRKLPMTYNEPKEKIMLLAIFSIALYWYQ